MEPAFLDRLKGARPPATVPNEARAEVTAPAPRYGAPLLNERIPAAAVMPGFVFDKKPLERHLWFFKVIGDQLAGNRAALLVDPSRPALTFSKLRSGLQALGVTNPGENFLFAGAVELDRGGRQWLAQLAQQYRTNRQALRQRGISGAVGMGYAMVKTAAQAAAHRGPLEIDISEGGFWSTGHPMIARSGVYDAQGNLDVYKERKFLELLDPAGANHITSQDFSRAAKAIMAQREPGSGLVDQAKRLNDEGIFDRAWGSFLKLAGHEDATGTRYVTREDVRAFFDGSYFFRLALALQPGAVGKSYQAGPVDGFSATRR